MYAESHDEAKVPFRNFANAPKNSVRFATKIRAQYGKRG